MKSWLISLIIGLVVTTILTFTSYHFAQFANQNTNTRQESAFFELLEFVQNKLDDIKLNTFVNEKSDSESVLVAIDEDSINEIGRWPWSREIVALLTEEIMKYGAKSLTYDIVFSEEQKDNPLADKRLGAVIEKYRDRIILGTASIEQQPTRLEPYKDICVTEAFLYLGGASLTKIPEGNRPRFVIDDQTEIYETALWDKLFKVFFDEEKENTKKIFFKERNIRSTDNLTFFQQNALNQKISKAIYNYCFVWLTTDDYFLYPINDRKTKFYAEVLGKVLNEESLEQEIKKIKEIKPHPIPQYVGWLLNMPQIQNPSLYTASFNIKPDSDGIVRYYSLFSRVGNKTGSSFIPSLGLQMYLHANQLRSEVSFAYSKKNGEKIISEFDVQSLVDEKAKPKNLNVDEYSRIRISYYGKGNTFPYVSAKDLIDKENTNLKVTYFRDSKMVEEIMAKKEFLKDRTVLLGPTALGLYDLRNTPVANLFPAPEIHLSAFANLVDNKFILPLKESEKIVSWSVAAFGLLFTIVWVISSPFWMPILLLSFGLLVYGADLLVYKIKNVMFVSWPIYAVLGLTFAGIATYKYFTEEKKRRQIKKAFSKYVSPVVVNELLKSDSNLALGGKKQRLAVFFSDLRGFTTFSEQLDPQALTEFLNLYFNKMTEEVFKANGTLDKFIGDALMAFFGAPLPQANNSELACKCALNSLQRLDELNKELKNQRFPELEMGIGINTGDMSVGNMGSSIIQNYTVMGDAVNLASRLEGLTKEYGVKIIIGEQTYLDIKHIFVCRELDLVRVKGRTEASPIYELILDRELQVEEKEWLNNYNRAREFYKNRFFNEAKHFYQESLQLNKKDFVSQIFLERCNEYLTNPPDLSWDGVFVLKNK